MSIEKNAYSHKKLMVWQKAIKLVIHIYKITNNFPRHELYGLTSQMRRSVISIPSNIAEGHGRNSYKEQIRFLNIAKGSIYELDTQIEISRQLKYMNPDEFDHISSLLDETSRMLSGLKKSKFQNAPPNSQTSKLNSHPSKLKPQNSIVIIFFSHILSQIRHAPLSGNHHASFRKKMQKRVLGVSL